MKVSVFLWLFIVVALPAWATSAKDTKVQQARVADAISRSESDQTAIKQKLNKAKEDRIESWAKRETNSIKIIPTSPTLTSDSFEANTHDAELEGLRKDVVLENDMPDFDAELIEVDIEPRPELAKDNVPIRTTAGKTESK